MTFLAALGLILVLFICPFCTGNLYSLVFGKKQLGLVESYLSGMAILYAILFVIQLAIIKFKFDLVKAGDVYTVLFITCLVLGTLCFLWNLKKHKSMYRCSFEWKKNWFVYVLILLQVVLYIVLKNPYFENNALLETTRVIMETGTIYEYNGYTGLVAVNGFPLSNKLMLLPVLYAYLCNVFGISPAVLFNFILPIVTCVSFYLVMSLWLKKIGEESGISYRFLMCGLIFIVQVGDGWSQLTAFRVLHAGYTGEAIFFGVLFAYLLYSIKNRRYLIVMACITAFPGLVKYDMVFDFVKYFSRYYDEWKSHGGLLIIFVVAVIYNVIRNKKFGLYLLNLNLTIAIFFAQMWNLIMEQEKEIWKKRVGGTILILLLFVCGSFQMVSGATAWRSNVYGVPKEEYELINALAMISEEENTSLENINVMAHDNLGRWIMRMDTELVPVVGYDLGGQDIRWYSYETYDESHKKVWHSVHNVTHDMAEEIVEISEEIPIDFVVVEKITDYIPLYEDTSLKWVMDTPSYIVYSVDKK